MEKDADQLLAALAVEMIEAVGGWAVEIQNADYLIVRHQGHHQFGPGRGIAGDVSGKLVDVGYHLTVRAFNAAVPHTPLPTGMRMQAGLPWNGPTTSSPSFSQ